MDRDFQHQKNTSACQPNRLYSSSSRESVGNQSLFIIVFVHENSTNIHHELRHHPVGQKPTTSHFQLVLSSSTVGADRSLKLQQSASATTSPICLLQYLAISAISSSHMAWLVARCSLAMHGETDVRPRDKDRMDRWQITHRTVNAGRLRN